MISGRFFKLAGGIFLLVAISSIMIIAFLPSSAYMERSLTIKSSPETIYQELISFRNFKKRSPWAVNNPDAVYTVYGPESGVGAGIRWENGNEDFQSGSIEVIDVLENQYVINKMEFVGYDSNPQSKWMLNPTDSGTIVTWAFEENNIEGFNKVFMLGIDGFLGDIYEQGLMLLKERVESLPTTDHQICVVDVTSQPYLGIKDMSINDRDLLSGRMKANFELIFEHINRNGFQITGPPFTTYTSFSDEEIAFINGIPIARVLDINHELIFEGETYDGKAVNGIYVGDYEYVMDVYRSIESYIFYHNYERSGNIWEEYHENTMSYSDSTNWEVQVYYPIK